MIKKEVTREELTHLWWTPIMLWNSRSRGFTGGYRELLGKEAKEHAEKKNGRGIDCE